MHRLAKLHAVADLRVGSGPGPDAPPAGWSTVAVTSVGLCGSDLHWYAEGGTGEVSIVDPVVPGHEFAGVALDGPYAGQRVAVDPAIPCGHCEWCRAGHGNLCPDVRFAGHGHLDGGLQDRLIWPDELLFPLPDAISDDGGALLEPLAHRRRTAERFGVTAAWAPEETAAAVLAATSGRGVDVVVEMAGADDGVVTAIACARPGARIALGGIPSTPLTAFPAAPARRKGLTFAMVRRMHATYPRAIELATTGIDLDDLVSDTFPLERAGDAFEHAVRRTGDKTVIRVSESSSPGSAASSRPPRGWPARSGD